MLILISGLNFGRAREPGARPWARAPYVRPFSVGGQTWDCWASTFSLIFVVHGAVNFCRPSWDFRFVKLRMQFFKIQGLGG